MVIRKFIIVLLLISAFCATYAQEEGPVIKPSTDKIILDGKVYFIHVVKEKETLKAISKAYHVTEKVIALENPDVFRGITPGMYLKIPTDPVHAEEITIQSTDDFHYHVIKQGETLFFLSRKYGIPVEVIESYNPEIQYSELQINQVIKIPKNLTKETTGNFSTEDYFFHFVRKGETLYSLASYYNVSIESIKELNPELKWGELKYDEYIKIPRIKPVSEIDTISLPVDTSLTNIYKILSDSGLADVFVETGCDSLIPVLVHETLDIGLFLPFFLQWDQQDTTVLLEDITELNEQDSGKDQAKEEEEVGPLINPRIIGYLEFYQGVLLALDSLRNLDVSVNLYVFDTERDTNIVRQILNRPETEQLDLIIGPFTEPNLVQVSDYGLKKRIPVISPFTNCAQALRNNPYMIQLQPSLETEYNHLADFISDYYNETIILIYDGDSLEFEKIKLLKQEIYEKMAYRAFLGDVSIKEVIYNDTSTYDIEQILTRDTQNIIIIPSNNEGYVSNILTPLYFLIEDYNITIFGTPNWQKFKTIDLEYLHNLDVHFYTTFYVDYTNYEVKNFIKKFRMVFFTEPYRVSPRGYNLSMYGYDIMFYFSLALNTYGRSFIYCPGQVNYVPMLGPYSLHRPFRTGGFMNDYIMLIRYRNDLNIEVIEPSKTPATYSGSGAQENRLF